MEQTGINDRVEREAETGQRERIDESEIDPGSALERFAPRMVNRRVGCINRTDIMTQTGEIERIFSGSAADIEHCAHNVARLGQADNGWLRSANLP